MAEDRLRQGASQDNVDYVSDLMEGVAAVTGIGAAAFALSNTKRFTRVLNQVDTMLERTATKINRIDEGIDGPVTISDIFDGIRDTMQSSNQFNRISFDGEMKDLLMAKIKTDPKLGGSGFDYSNEIYKTHVQNALYDTLNTMGFEKSSIDTLSDKFANNYSKVFSPSTGGLTDEGEALFADIAANNTDIAFNPDDGKLLLDKISDIKSGFAQSRREFNETNPYADDSLEAQIAQRHTEAIDKQIAEVQRQQEIRETVTGQKAYRWKDFLADIDSGVIDRKVVEDQFDFVTPDGENKNLIDELTRNIERNRDFYEQIKDLAVNSSTRITVNGERQQTPFLNKMFDSLKDGVKQSLPAKLLDFTGKTDPVGVEMFSRADFNPTLKRLANESSEGIVRIGKDAYNLETVDGKLKLTDKLDTSNITWVESDSTAAEVQRRMNMRSHGYNGDNGFLQRGESSKVRTSDIDGNNYATFRNNDVYDRVKDDVTLANRVHGFRRSLDGIDIKINRGAYKRIFDQMSDSEKEGETGYLIRTLLEDDFTKQTNMLREGKLGLDKETELFKTVEAIKRGRKIQPALKTGGVEPTESSLYNQLTPEQHVRDQLQEEINYRLLQNMTPAQAREFLRSKGLNRGEIQKFIDVHNLRRLKNIDQGGHAATEYVNERAKDKNAARNLGDTYNSILQDDEVRNTLDYYLGNSTDYKTRYRKVTPTTHFTAVNKGLNVKQLITDINSLDIKGIGNNLRNATNGLLANTRITQTTIGRWMPTWMGEGPFKNTTEADLSVGGAILYRMLDRLSEGLNNASLSGVTGVINHSAEQWLDAHIKNGVALGLSENYSRSSAQMLDGLIFKRALPAALLYTQYDWFNDTFDNEEAFWTGYANIDLAGRKIVDNLGLTDVFKRAKMANPLAQYISGDYTPYQSYDERLDYWQNGSDPIRSGRYWIFGSAAEFRGSSIQYWEPNSLRIAQSDYRTKAIYGDYWTKWSNSPIPTLSNPLSPLWYAINPYRVEEMHSEDRPYLLSGPMFGSDTPMSILLNSTIGEVIKPQKRYHQDRMWFGRDVKAIMYHMNQQIQQENNDNRYLIYQNGRLGVYDFTAFNHPTETEYISDGSEQAYGVNPVYTSAADFSNAINTDGSVNPLPQPYTGDTSTGGASSIKQALTAMNASIHGNVPQTNANGIYLQQRIRRSSAQKKTIDSLLQDADVYNNLMNSSGGRDYLDELVETSRLLTGIYGYGGQTLIGRSNEKFLANAGDITSSARFFWDSGIGGLGGEGMEIARRFIPNYSRRNRLNPLMNDFAEKYPWLNERFFIGDGYTSIINGEARLPGAGYEALNQLHPDQFGSYGAIDRYKILADVAPNTPEYKFWKQIVKMMDDPEAQRVLKRTEEQVKHQGQTHDFFDYRFLDKTTTAINANVEEVLSNGKFTIAGDTRLYQVAGVKFNEQGFRSQQQLQQLLNSGSKVVLRIDDIERNEDPEISQQPIKAAVFVDGQNLSDMLREAGLAEYDMDDTSAAGAYANYNVASRIIGSGIEFLTHLNVPILHSQFMRINSPLEEYRQDQLYGTGFASWDSIYGSMIQPAFYMGKANLAWDFAADLIHRVNNFTEDRNISVGKRTRTLLKWGDRYADRSALVGHFIGKFGFAGANSNEAKERWSGRMRTAGNVFALASSLNDPMYATYAWGRVGWDLVGKYINPGNIQNEEWNYPRRAMQFVAEKGWFGKVGTEFLEDAIRDTRIGRVAVAAGMAATGLGLSLVSNNPITEFLGIGSSVYVPDSVKQRWDTEEYFDRLRYIKYMALYRAAADKAKSVEGVDLDKLYAHQEFLRAQINGDISLTDMMSSVLVQGTPSNDPIAVFKNVMFGKLSDQMTTLSAGEYTEQAVMYRQVAESTIYGLNENSEYSDIIRALPKTEKEYFIQFVKEQDESKRKEILKTVSPSLRKALRLVWYEENTEMESNEEYFGRHHLPGPLWEGWSVQNNLEDIKAKVIYNEGMAYADYGIYSSAYERDEVINAPNIDSNIRDGDDMITVRAKLATVMRGVGLDDTDIRISQTTEDGALDIIQNVTAVIGYKIDKAMSFF